MENGEAGGRRVRTASLGSGPSRVAPRGVPHHDGAVPHRQHPRESGLRGLRIALLVLGLLGGLGRPSVAQQHSETQYTGAPFNFCLPGYDSYDYQDCWDFNWEVINSSFTKFDSSMTYVMSVATGIAASTTTLGSRATALESRATALEVWQGTTSPRVAAFDVFMGTTGPKVDSLTVWQGTASVSLANLLVWQGTASVNVAALNISTANLAAGSATTYVQVSGDAMTGELTRSIASGERGISMTSGSGIGDASSKGLKITMGHNSAQAIVVRNAADSQDNLSVDEANGMALRVPLEVVSQPTTLGGLLTANAAINTTNLTASGLVQAGTLTVTQDGNNVPAIIAQTGSGQVAGLQIQRGAFRTDIYTDYSLLDEGGLLTLYSYRSSASTPIFTVTGNDNIIAFNSQVRVPVGSASSPGIVFDGDTNTGIYRQGSNNSIGFISGGVENMYVDASHVVITTMDVSGASAFTSTLTVRSLMFSGSSAAKLEYDTTYGLKLGSGGGLMLMLDMNNSDNEILWFTKNGYTLTDPNTTRLGALSQGGELFGFASITSTSALFGVNGGVNASQTGPTTTPVSEVSLENRGNMRQQGILYTGNQTVGGSSDVTALAGPSPLQIGIFDGSASWGEVIISTGASATSQAGIALAKTRDTGLTGSANTVVVNGDAIGGIYAYGADGSSYRRAGAIEFYVDGTPGASDMPGRLTFSTVLDGAATLSERMRITNAGDVGINTTAPATKLDVNGSAQFGSGATKSTFTATPGGATYALYTSSGIRIAAGGVDIVDTSHYSYTPIAFASATVTSTDTYVTTWSGCNLLTSTMSITLTRPNRLKITHSATGDCYVDSTSQYCLVSLLMNGSFYNAVTGTNDDSDGDVVYLGVTDPMVSGSLHFSAVTKVLAPGTYNFCLGVYTVSGGATDHFEYFGATAGDPGTSNGESTFFVEEMNTGGR